MSENVAIELIGLVGLIITGVLTSKSQFNKLISELDKRQSVTDAKNSAQLEKYQAVTNEKIEELHRETEKHNKVIERTYKLEKDVGIIKAILNMSEKENE